jgi:hypothetical protein
VRLQASIQGGAADPERARYLGDVPAVLGQRRGDRLGLLPGEALTVEGARRGDAVGG